MFSVAADQFLVSIHPASGGECLYQSVLGGRGEREKVRHLVRIYPSASSGCAFLMALERAGGGCPLLRSLSQGMDCLQYSTGRHNYAESHITKGMIPLFHQTLYLEAAYMGTSTNI